MSGRGKLGTRAREDRVARGITRVTSRGMGIGLGKGIRTRVEAMKLG